MGKRLGRQGRETTQGMTPLKGIRMKDVRRFNKKVSPMSFPRIGGTFLAMLAFIALSADVLLFAQSAGPHLLYDASTPPGMIGQAAMLRAPDVVGYFQPVEVRAPEGVHVSFIQGGFADQATPVPTKAGLLIGQVYRFRLSHIPLRPGSEIYPTIELLDRLHPPAGQEVRYPIVVELTEEDLRLASNGILVTRIVYLEDPQAAVPVRGDIGGQSWFEVEPGRDPLQVADAMGRPMAIVRLGGRTPSRNGGMIDSTFSFGEPPFVRYQPEPSLADPLMPPVDNGMIPALPVGHSTESYYSQKPTTMAPARAPLPPSTWGPAGARAAEVLGRSRM